MSFTGEFVKAEIALQAGLVTEVVSHDELLPFARSLASTIADTNRSALSALQASYRSIEAETLRQGLEIEHQNSQTWTQGGGTRRIADRVDALLERGRSHTTAGH